MHSLRVKVQLATDRGPIHQVESVWLIMKRKLLLNVMMEHLRPFSLNPWWFHNLQSPIEWMTWLRTALWGWRLPWPPFVGSFTFPLCFVPSQLLFSLATEGFFNHLHALISGQPHIWTVNTDDRLHTMWGWATEGLFMTGMDQLQASLTLEWHVQMTDLT